MTTASDARFWDRSARKYAKSKISDPAGYERTLDRVQAQLKPEDRVLELGCGTGTTALRLAGAVGTYLATDISSEMITVAKEKHATSPVAGLAFDIATADTLASEPNQFDVVLGFNYLHMVRDVSHTLRCIHNMLAPDGLFLSKTPCLGEMNPMIRHILLPVLGALGKAPHVSVFTAAELVACIRAAGFVIVATESHATKGKDTRPYIVARKL